MFKAALLLALSADPALAATMMCSPMSNADVLKHVESSVGETLRFVGIMKMGGPGRPFEVTVSKTGTWSLSILTEDGVCFLGIGDGWQAVEPKPEGTEN